MRRLAERQHGRIARRQLLELGCSRGWITGRIASGFLIPEHSGVYAVGVLRDDVLGRAMAAVLACGPGALLSHGSAAALWKIRAPTVRITWERIHLEPAKEAARLQRILARSYGLLGEPG